MNELIELANTPIAAGMLVLFFGWLAKSSLEHRFDGIDKRFDLNDKRFDLMDKRFDSIDKEIAIIKSDIKSLDSRVSNLEGQFKIILDYFMPQKRAANDD